MPPPPLSTRLATSRFTLRPLRGDDARALIAALKRNADHLAPWSPTALVTPHARTAIRVAADVARMRRSWKKDVQYNLFVFANDDPGVILGRITLTVSRGSFQNAYLGYWCDHGQQRVGLMTECLAVAVAFAFDALALHRIQAAIMPRNSASLRVIEKLAFRREGIAERYLQIAGVWEDHLLFARTAEEHATADDA